MIRWLLFVFLISGVAGKQHQTCEKTYQKIGCFKSESDKLKRKYHLELIINDRDQGSKYHQNGYATDWKNFELSLQSLACRCANAARSKGMGFFELRFYGECWAGFIDLYTVRSLLNDAERQSDQCQMGTFEKCDENSHKECVGEEGNGFMYMVVNAGGYQKSVDGGLSEWTAFSECSTTCGEGVKFRERFCNNPVPKGGGRDCSELGPLEEEVKCQVMPCAPKIYRNVACEGKELQITCAEGVINISNAYYGRKHKQFCTKWNNINSSTCKIDVTHVLKTNCNNRKSCSVRATNQFFTDPCHGIYKYLDAKYYCK